jgi:hypothetical protein
MFDVCFVLSSSDDGRRLQITLVNNDIPSRDIYDNVIPDRAAHPCNRKPPAVENQVASLSNASISM